MAIPTLDAFKFDTRKVFVKQSPGPRLSFLEKLQKAAYESDLARGRNIIPIDRALDAYWAKQGAPVQQKVIALSHLVDLTLGWLKKKKTKSNFKISDGEQIVNHVFKERKRAITHLANEALKELFTMLVRNDMVGHDNLGRIKFFINKTNHSLHAQVSPLHNFHGPNVPGTQITFGYKPLRAMGDDYTLERDSYLEYKRQNNLHKGNHSNRPNLSPEGVHFSGSGVHATHKAIAKVGSSVDATNALRAAEGKAPFNRADRMMNNLNVPQKHQGRIIAVIDQLIQADVHNLSPDQWRILDEIGRITGNSGSVQYEARDQRFDYMAIADDKGRLRDSENRLINAREGNAYAMDEYGNFFQHNAEHRREGFKYFNHSTFNAGKDVICAGTLKIENGILRLITNETGHYKSTRENVANCVDVLYCEGVDLTNTDVRITVYFRGQDGLSYVNQHTYDALSFLMNPNGNPKATKGPMLAE
jgi:hypothetical protein